jgi:hypothetical protein
MLFTIFSCKVQKSLADPNALIVWEDNEARDPVIRCCCREPGDVDVCDRSALDCCD